MRKTTLTVLVLTLLILVVLVAWWWWERRQPRLPAETPQAPVLEFTGPAEGWPPSPKGATNVTLVPWEEIPGSLTDVLESEIRQAALQDPRVRELLGNRFAYISTDEIEPEKEQKQDASQPLATRVTFFSHANNVAIEVRMSGTTVENVTKREEGQPPEGQDEIKAAIALAQRDQRLRGKLQGLIGSAILASLQAGQPGYGHRVLDVTFTREGEDVPRYFALVDLTDRRVLAGGPTAAREGR